MTSLDDRPDPIPEDGTRILGQPVNWNRVLDPLLGGTDFDTEEKRSELAYLFRATFGDWLLHQPGVKITHRHRKDHNDAHHD